MTDATFAPDQQDVAALRRRLAALEAENAALRTARDRHAEHDAARGAIRDATRSVEAEAVEVDPISAGTGGLVSESALLRALLDAGPHFVTVLDPGGRILFMNPSCLAALDVGRLDEVAGLPWTSFWDEAQAGATRSAVDAARSGRTVRFQTSCRTRRGTLRSGDVVVAPFADGSGHLLAAAQDAATRTDALTARDEKLAATELLLQEVHHRVKNSVQMVQNLLNLQARSCADPVAAAQLADSAARVHMIGLIHDRLYRSGDAMAVEVHHYLHELVRDLHAGMASELERRTVQVKADPATWPASEVPPLGLVLTELVINALKYGRGTVQVTFRQDDPEDRGSAVLIVEDEGAGLPAEFDPARSTGLGMRLVQGMLRRGNAGLTLDRGVGHTRFVVRLG